MRTMCIRVLAQRHKIELRRRGVEGCAQIHRDPAQLYRPLILVH